MMRFGVMVVLMVVGVCWRWFRVIDRRCFGFGGWVGLVLFVVFTVLTGYLLFFGVWWRVVLSAGLMMFFCFGMLSGRRSEIEIWEVDKIHDMVVRCRAAGAYVKSVGVERGNVKFYCGKCDVTLEAPEDKERCCFCGGKFEVVV